MAKKEQTKQQISSKVLWGGAIIAPLVCAISIWDIILDYQRLSLASKLWGIFIVIFTGYYSYIFIRDLRVRLQSQKDTK